MKLVVGKFAPLTAALVLLSPCGLFAQNIASRPGLVDRSVERVTLLPGPTRLSPAPFTVVPTAKVEFQSTQPWANPSGHWYLGPAASRAAGTLTLGSDAHRREFAPPRAQRLPSADSLRFDATLQTPPKLKLSK